MVLDNCYECGGKVSSSATLCSHCGYTDHGSPVCASHVKGEKEWFDR